MIAALRQRLTYANVMATLTFFMVLGGGAYAASQLPANSVGSKQIKGSAVSSSKVRDRSLLAKDFKTGQLPRGARGDRGAPGELGPSHAYSVAKTNASVCPQNPSFCTGGALTLPNLPAGAYAVFAKIRPDVTSATGSRTTFHVTCSLVAGSDSDQAQIELSADGADHANVLQMNVPLQLIHTFSASGSVALTCQEPFNNPRYYDAKITAIKVRDATPVAAP